MTRALSDRQVVPESIKEMDIWVLWNMKDKTPLAPWSTGHMYRAQWGEDMLNDADVDVDVRPECSYREAKMLADMRPVEIHSSYPFPPEPCEVNEDCDGCRECADNDPMIPDEVRPTILLPHNPDEPRLMQVDFDDVRDPESGEVTDEVWEIVEELNSYTEVSSSGTGLHVFVFATLPGHLEKFLADLDSQGGGVEMYDHGRFVGATWEHVESTPISVEDRQDVVNELVERYESDEQRERREGADRSFSEKRAEAEREVGLTSTSSGGSSGHNAYYALDTTDIAESDATFRQYEKRGKGPHPAHGGTNHADSESTNFQVSDGAWNCFVPGHGGGGPLELIAVMEGVCRCDDAQRGYLKSNPLVMLKTCLLARDKYANGHLDEERPPYEALVGVAREMDLVFADDAKTELSRDARHLAEKVYASMSAEEVDV
jgi:hypothetical protein